MGEMWWNRFSVLTLNKLSLFSPLKTWVMFYKLNYGKYTQMRSKTYLFRGIES